jgi:AcrR family transcriptional regulator
MTGQASPAPRTGRNAQRTAETRLRLVEAAVKCLNQYGYAATTTIRVPEMAGVTRGGMLHHFPSKADLIIATAEHCLLTMRETRLAQREPAVVGPPSNAVMSVERGRYGIALTEIMIGSRSDQELADRFKPVAQMMLDFQRQAAATMAEQEGLSDVHALEVMVWLHMAAIRGMSLMNLAGVDHGFDNEALQLLISYRKGFFETLRLKQSELAPLPKPDS